MKKIICFIFLFTGLLAYSQELPPEIDEETCATTQLMNSLMSENPDVKLRIDMMDQELSTMDNSARATLPMITIPVVILVVHGGAPIGTQSNISDAQVNAQLTALNTYFNPYGIKFCLATMKGTQSIPNAIQRYNNSALSSHDALTEQAALVSLGNGYTPDRFLRIWVVKSIDGLGSGVLGYSMFPNASTVFDGVVMRYDVFGNGTGLLANYNQGKTLVHEVAHYLGLYHTFHESCSGMNSSTWAIEGDRVGDTPPVASPNFACTAVNSCNESAPDLPDDIHNYMDYGNDSCVNEFTDGQIQRIFNILTTYRSTLFSSDNLIYTGVCNYQNLLSASFTPTTYAPCVNSAIVFNPLVTGATYSWNFGDGSTSSAQNPSHAFTSVAGSPYTVTLTITRNGVSTISTAQIFVTTCSPILNSEGTWYFSSSNGLNFNSGVPVVNTSINPANTFTESCAVQNNALGNLLFYTNGVNVWNNAHNPINAANLLSGHQSSKSGVIIVPNPANASQYYIFTKDAHSQIKGFRYSIVNVTGTTATMSTTINQPVTFPAGYVMGTNNALLGGEGVTAVQNCNGYWIITALKKTTGYFLVVYSLTNAGLSYNSEFALPTTMTDFQTSLEVAPNGNKLLFYGVLAGGFIFDFNKFTGIITNQVALPNSSSGYGVSFSPDSNLLYLSVGGKFYQYNLNSTNMSNDRILIGTISTQTGDIQKGPDNKLYISAFSNKMGTIHSPNTLASQANPNACSFTSNGPLVQTPLVFALPNMIDAKIATAYNNTISGYPLSCNTYVFYPNACGVSFNWNFGDPSSGANNSSNKTVPTHIFSADGTYTVTLLSATNVIIATMTITVGTTVPAILGSDRACTTTTNTTNNSVVLEPGQTVIWSITGGAGTISGVNNQSNVTVNWSTLPGTLTLTVTNASGCSASITQTINNICACDCLPTAYFTTTSGLPNTVNFQALNSNPNPACAGGFKYSWVFGDGTSLNSFDSTPSHTYSAVGTYNVSLRVSVMGLHDEGLCTSTPFVSAVTVGGKGKINPASIGVNNVTIHPNPNKGNFTVQFNSDSGNDVAVSVHDISGRKIFDKKYTNTGLFSQNLQLDGVQTGVYLVTVQEGDAKIVKRIVVE